MEKRASRRRWGRDRERGVSGREVKVIEVIYNVII